MHRHLWEAGDKTIVAPSVQAAAALVAATASIGEGDQVLDVAAGTGYTAESARCLGGRVWGLDLFPDLFAQTRAASLEAAPAEAGWLDGRPEPLAFADNSFHKVTSFFGLTAVPHHAAAVAETIRVCRRGATLALATWAPGSFIEELYGALAGAAASIDRADDRSRWADPAYLRVLFGRAGARVTIAEGEVLFAFRSAEAAIQAIVDRYGPGTRDAVRDLVLSAREPQADAWRARASFYVIRVDLP